MKILLALALLALASSAEDWALAGVILVLCLALTAGGPQLSKNRKILAIAAVVGLVA